MLLGLLVGLIGLRTRGNYFAIFTAAIGVMIATVFTNWQDLTGGNIGIVNIAAAQRSGPTCSTTTSPSTTWWWSRWRWRSRSARWCATRWSGATFLAIADNESLARATGIDVARTRIVAFVLSTFLAGFAGGIFAMYQGNLDPGSSGLDITFEQLLYLVIGGIGTIAGPLLGTLVLVTVSELLQGIQQYRFLIFGPLLVVLVIFFPRGIVGVFDRLVAPRLRRQPAAPVGDAEAVRP